MMVALYPTRRPEGTPHLARHADLAFPGAARPGCGTLDGVRGVCAIVLLVVAGCYDPHPVAGAPCGEGNTCPTGQHCLDGFCRADGQLGADAAATDGPLTDALPPGDGSDAAGACAGGDGVCLVACVATDPDCQTTCGDSVCVGNAGELCGNCAADCATLTPTCGNGACETGEAPDCFADCGPVPWTWTADEASLLAMINNARTTGAACPSATGVVRPAVTADAGLQVAAREWVWELSHHDYFMTGGVACNGRTLADRKAIADFDSYVVNRGSTSVTTVFQSWMASTSACPILMEPSVTKISVSVAMDVKRSYLVVTK